MDLVDFHSARANSRTLFMWGNPCYSSARAEHHVYFENTDLFAAVACESSGVVYVKTHERSKTQARERHNEFKHTRAQHHYAFFVFETSLNQSI